MPTIKTAEIGRFDGELKKIAFNDGDTIQNLLDRANITLSSGEEINDERGNEVLVTDSASETIFYITGNFSNGITSD